LKDLRNGLGRIGKLTDERIMPVMQSFPGNNVRIFVSGCRATYRYNSTNEEAAANNDANDETKIQNAPIWANVVSVKE